MNNNTNPENDKANELRRYQGLPERTDNVSGLNYDKQRNKEAEAGKKLKDKLCKQK